jgi:hypothetical protein
MPRERTETNPGEPVALSARFLHHLAAVGATTIVGCVVVGIPLLLVLAYVRHSRGYGLVEQPGDFLIFPTALALFVIMVLMPAAVVAERLYASGGWRRQFLEFPTAVGLALLIATVAGWSLGLGAGTRSVLHFPLPGANSLRSAAVWMILAMLVYRFALGAAEQATSILRRLFGWMLPRRPPAAPEWDPDGKE